MLSKNHYDAAAIEIGRIYKIEKPDIFGLNIHVKIKDATTYQINENHGCNFLLFYNFL